MSMQSPCQPCVLVGSIPHTAPGARDVPGTQHIGPNGMLGAAEGRGRPALVSLGAETKCPRPCLEAGRLRDPYQIRVIRPAMVNGKVPIFSVFEPGGVSVQKGELGSAQM